ncbi:phosphotransferase enzyme family-domain-containing protein [Chaetomium strumarium]|uniref:Phosphotransferase enzyme family-domain-containing protein n=1 Tax=Chaetomium strumarium TaxID=1170767 RepID=A0AAJ0GMT6_9PEZI|nr:phosphotransferase enzyme family-domain-containing protein [Chaetomium strumarium]
MAALSHNHAKYKERFDYIQELLDAEQTKITPVQYEPDFPFKYNNFVYRLLLPVGTPDRLGSASEGSKLEHLPGCIPIPAGTKEFIVRRSNPDAEGIHQETRVQNEVAILTLASAALRHVKPALVPRIFVWGSAGHGRIGWILQELMPGAPLAEEFRNNMSLDQKRGILTQMARLLKALQDYQLPESIKGWGGLTFDDSGAIVSAPMPTVGAGPWSSPEESYKDRLKAALARVDVNPHLQGWRANGVRERVDAFIEHGLPAYFAHLTSKQDRTIVHADFVPENLLYDPPTGRITALLDYDFASIQHPGYEFFRSFSTNGGSFLGWSGGTTPEKQEAEALRNAKLTGRFPSPLPAPVVSDKGAPAVDWELAHAWEVELQELDVKRPSTIQGIDKLADVDELLGSLLPFILTNGDFLRMNTDENQRKDMKAMSERKLVGLLEHLGF